MIIVFLFIALIYSVLIIGFFVGFQKLKTIKKTDLPPKTTFSVVVPFRNETANLPQLLNSFEQLNYPTHLFEILFVNDASEDNSCVVIENFQQQFPHIKTNLLQNNRTTNSPKKDAINTAISSSKFEWIVTTDADCIVSIYWLQLFNQFIEAKNPVLIAAPVIFKKQNSLLFHFQNLNFISLMGSTIGSFGIKKSFMCNGANLCYQKTAFKNVNGFEGNTSIASGDDVFLLEKMVKNYPEQVLFLKSAEATVTTNSEKNWSLYLNQQIRWASKSTAYNSNFSKFVGIVVLSTNLLVLSLFISAILNPFFWKYFLVIFIQKTIVDFILIKKTSDFLINNNSLKYFLLVAFLYPFFITYVGISSTFKSYTWKGRVFKK
ncbi:glycosyltransferase [Lutibacter sp. HS1-25]|uniref:glycosyltransferase family 2 protein n=1 Tax=Lutibacter sp. HS1-25 TaxID=2485000 RepID=UPI00101283FE|nr:glycosyltransferase [Lutibacter sp. HS1-25]RXP56582.1 glycosyltransferase [Lutibacter sp. HS1-25]